MLAADEPDDDDDAPTLQRDGRHVLTITWAVRWQQGEGRDGRKEAKKGGGGEGTRRSREEETKKIDLGTEEILTSAQREKEGG